jgi:hypothetical protein
MDRREDDEVRRVHVNSESWFTSGSLLGATSARSIRRHAFRLLSRLCASRTDATPFSNGERRQTDFLPFVCRYWKLGTKCNSTSVHLWSFEHKPAILGMAGPIAKPR